VQLLNESKHLHIWWRSIGTCRKNLRCWSKDQEGKWDLRRILPIVEE